mgnify:FL=1
MGGTVGGFNISGGRMTGSNSDSYGNKFTLSPTMTMYGSYGIPSAAVGFGLSAIPATTGQTCPAVVLNTLNSREGATNGFTLILYNGSARYSNTPQRWLNCQHYTNSGWGSGFSVESRYFGDSNNMERTIVNFVQLPTLTQLKKLRFGV